MKIRFYFLAMAALMISACSGDKEKSKDTPAVSVKIYYPSAAMQSEMFVSGIVTARQTAMVSTRLMGNIDRIYVKQGDQVSKGQVLLTINSSDIKAKEAQAMAVIAEATAAANDAQKDYKRYEVLHAKNSVSDKELENMAFRNTSARARLQVARQSLNEVKAILSYAQVRAPFSGVVTQKMADEGSIANPGMPLLTIEQAGELNVTASVPESYVSHVKKGDKVMVDIKSINTRFEGVISELSPSASMTGGQYAMKIVVNGNDKERLRAGMYAGIRIAGKPTDKDTPDIWARKSSIVHRDQLTGVYVVGSDNRAVLHWVRLGADSGDNVAVLSGLKASDRVIDNPSARIYNGKKIKITN